MIKYSETQPGKHLREEVIFLMTLFYDPVDEADQQRIEKILRDGGVEYFLREEPEKKLGPFQVHVAEEDIPRAEQLLQEAQTSH